MPLEKWYKFELRDWAEDLLNSNNLSLSGLFDENQVKKIWNYQLKGYGNYRDTIWSILMFQSWFINNYK